MYKVKFSIEQDRWYIVNPQGELVAGSMSLDLAVELCYKMNYDLQNEVTYE